MTFSNSISTLSKPDFKLAKSVSLANYDVSKSVAFFYDVEAYFAKSNSPSILFLVRACSSGK